MNTHLITVEISIKSRTYQRMQLNGRTLYQSGLEGLNTHAVKRGCSVKEYEVLIVFILQHFLDLNRIDILRYDTLCRDKLLASFILLSFNKGFEEFSPYLDGKPAFGKFQFRVDDNNCPAREINSLSQKVLTESALLASEKLCERFQRTAVGTHYGIASTAVVYQDIY